MQTYCAGIGSELHVCFLRSDGRFFHGIRNSDGTWNGLNDGSDIPNSGSNNRSVACAAVGRDLHVCLIKDDGRFFHAVRSHDGRWGTGFNDGSEATNSGRDNDSVSCSAVGGELHVCLRKTGERFFHAIRKRSGEWNGFNDGTELLVGFRMEIGSTGIVGEGGSEIFNNSGRPITVQAGTLAFSLPPGGKVDISTIEGHDSVIIEVWKSLPGVPPTTVRSGQILINRGDAAPRGTHLGIVPSGAIEYVPD